MIPTINIRYEVSSSTIKFIVSGDIYTDTVIRSEGALPIELVSHVAEFQLEDPNIQVLDCHPDHLGLMAILAFYPAIKASFRNKELIIKLEWSITEKLEFALNRPHILEGIRISGKSGLVSAYSPRVKEVISFGGGFDSLAASLLFPSALLVHESPTTVLEGRITDAVLDVRNQMPKEVFTVFTNQRYLFSTYGLPVWVGVFSSSLFYSPEVIITGSVMDSTYLQDGKGYRPVTDGLWYKVFSDLGITIRPTSYLSEYGNCQLLSQAKLTSVSSYCARIPFQDCGTCIKCLRRRLLRSAFGEPFGTFDPTDSALQELKQRPLKWGHTYGLSKDFWPDWMEDSLSDVKEELFSKDFTFQKYYFSQAFTDLNYPIDVAEDVKKRLKGAGIEPMPADLVQKFESFKAVGSK